MDVAITVDARLLRCVHVEEQFLEVQSLTALQHHSDGIVVLALHVQFHGGEQLTQGRLVDDFLLQLCRS